MNNTFCSKCHRIPSQCCCSPVKELTDEEILEQSVFCFGDQSDDFDDSYWIEFARAILRKAQEK